MVVVDVQFYASFVSCGLLTKENRLPECTTEVIKRDGKILLLPRSFLNPVVFALIFSEFGYVTDFFYVPNFFYVFVKK